MMTKKQLAACLLAAGLSVSAVAAAETFGATAQQAPHAVHTVTEAKKLADDQKVGLVGEVVKKTGHEREEFRDKSGSVIVEIDDKDWNGLSVTAADQVRIEGEVEHKRDGRVEIEVDRIVKL